jgi:hypothetical protein
MGSTFAHAPDVRIDRVEEAGGKTQGALACATAESDGCPN